MLGGGRLMPDWDALYLVKWLLIGLGEPRTLRSRYSFSLLKCLLNCIQTLAGPGCLRRGWRCVTCLTRLAGKGLFSTATPQPPAPARKATARRVSVHACLQGGRSSCPGFFPPKHYLTRLDTGLAGIHGPVLVPVCAGAVVRGGGLWEHSSSDGRLLAQRWADGHLVCVAGKSDMSLHPLSICLVLFEPQLPTLNLPIVLHRFAKICPKDYKLFMGNSAQRIQWDGIRQWGKNPTELRQPGLQWHQSSSG